MVCKALEKVDLATQLIGQVPVWELQRAGLTVVSQQTLESLLNLAASYRVENTLLVNSLSTYRSHIRAAEEQDLINCLLDAEDNLALNPNTACTGPGLVSSRARTAAIQAVNRAPSEAANPVPMVTEHDPAETNPSIHGLEQLQDVSL